MFKRMLILVLALSGSMAFADPKDDVEFFMSNVIDSEEWDRVRDTVFYASPRLYRAPLFDRDIRIVDTGRFREMIPESAFDEVFLLVKEQIAQLIVEGYGPEHIPEIAEFFQTPTGMKILSILSTQRWRSPLGNAGATEVTAKNPIDVFRDDLSLQEMGRYSAFSATPAGQAFANNTFAVRKAVSYAFARTSKWPKPPLNRSHIVEILKTDGVLKFSSRFTRQSLIRELSAALP